MFLKPCLPPERALLDLALKRRIENFHPKRSVIEEDYHHRMTGYRGEKSIDYYLEKLPKDKYDIIHDLRLPCTEEDKFFQIDTLVLSTSLILPLEVKNWAGDLHFDKHLNQVLRTFPNQTKKKRVQNPILQVHEQAHQLKNWLAHHNLGNVPVEYLFVNSNDKTIITTDPGNEKIFQRVCTNETLIDKIHLLTQTQKPANPKKSNLKKLGEALLAAHTPPVFTIQKLYNISPYEILTGVYCPKCLSLPMVYNKGTWYCSQCSHQSKTAHIETLNDYFLLIKPSITNAEFRQFLHISSARSTNRILKSLNLPYTGTNKGRIYYKPEKIFTPDA
ncbi:nuclease-related domain-containing protein [Bacillus sp. EB600]|uniref:nuclease-related domain-containing protein n=1 Tax=Bacillus sp. EB600 TaxID=2806345 RepID=UPI00210875D2|nr:nuclease-related domain-containing protein [Bacillus sp. EB600]MCQ6279911.1 NERD domain-containing protein [Bacillus sp. EB600]